MPLRDAQCRRWAGSFLGRHYFHDRAYRHDDSCCFLFPVPAHSPSERRRSASYYDLGARRDIKSARRHAFASHACDVISQAIVIEHENSGIASASRGLARPLLRKKSLISPAASIPRRFSMAAVIANFTN